MSKYIVAVSGGIDSVSLLDMMSQLPDHELIVAHFDHGIREDSASDAVFVEELARSYGLPFEMRREELGPNASEEKARARRYAFLRELADKHQAKIVTAHHADDAVESIAINLHRGTGWRGLAPLDSDIARPLLEMSKADLAEYAKRRNLQWREDSTNAQTKYLRNKIRQSLKDMSTYEKQQILKLRQEQLKTKQLIQDEIARLVGNGPRYSRYFFTHIPQKVAIECLRFVTKAKLTRPQLQKALHAIKTARPGVKHQLGAGLTLHFTSRNFWI